MARASFRHSLILILVALGTAMAAFGGWRFARASAPVNGPIVLISIDALRADRLPAYGYTNIRTPAIDALAADGVLFERAYSNVPQTLLTATDRGTSQTRCGWQRIRPAAGWGRWSSSTAALRPRAEPGAVDPERARIFQAVPEGSPIPSNGHRGGHG